MFKSISQTIFITVFIAMISIPLLMTNLQRGRIAESENRILAPMADLYNDDGTLNDNFTADFETWINDNIGYRSSMLAASAKIQYYLFGVLANNSDMYLGPDGELNYATKAMLEDYQHANLYSEKHLRKMAKSMQRLSDYAQENGAQFYYFQCWDKHSIYPEYFPDTVVQFGAESKTDGIVRALTEYSTVNTVSPKQALIDAKPEHSTFSIWGDPTHWTPRGAYVGYLSLMDAINSRSEISYKVLQESDYNITSPDKGRTLIGNIHRVDHIENFEIKDPKAVPESRIYLSHSQGPKYRMLINDAVENDTRLLVIGDSYFNTFIIDDLAESFHETIFVWNDLLSDYKDLINTYKADIVVLEAA